MKKFLKSLIYVLAFSLLLVTGIFSYSAIENANAVDVQSDITHTVNFYGSDNETIIYSVDIENGQKLNDLVKNNIIQNDSNFVNLAPFSTNLSRYNFGGWYTRGVNSQFEISKDSLSVDMLSLVDNNAITGCFLPLSNYSDLLGEEVTLTFHITASGSSHVPKGKFYFGLGDSAGVNSIGGEIGPYIFTDLGFDGLISYTATVPEINVNGGINVFIVMQHSQNHAQDYLNFDYVKLEYGSSSTSYFSLDYVNQLFINSGGVIGSDFAWSLSETVNTNFDFDTPITSDVNLYGYDFTGDNVSYEGSFELGNFASGVAINNVEALIIDGYFYSSMTITIDVHETTFGGMAYLGSFALDGSVSSLVDGDYYNTNYFVFNSNQDYFDLNACFFSYENLFKVRYVNNFGSYYALLYFDASTQYKSFDIYFSNLAFNSDREVVQDSVYSKKTNYLFTDGLDVVVDLNSNTNFSYDLVGENNYTIFQGHDNGLYFSYLLLSNLANTENSYFWDWSVDKIVDAIGEYSFVNSSCQVLFRGNNLSSKGCDEFFSELQGAYALRSEAVLDYIVNEFYFVIEKPYYRVDNTLIIYNYDYFQTLQYVNHIDYVLLRENTLYTIFSNGEIPNYSFINFYSNEILNTQFNRYVSLYLTFNDNKISYFSNGSFNDVKLGFDFNFTYFVEPLVTNNGVYNYTFNKPGYVDMPFSLVPFYLPVLEAVENVFIFLVFYCPLISDVVLLLHFDLFFGGLIAIFNFITGSAIGDFVLSCLAFLIFWSLLKGIFPSFVSNSRLTSQYFIDSIVDSSEFLDSPSVKRYKGYKFKSWLGSNNFEQVKANHLKRFNSVGYRGKKNSSLKKSYIRIAKMKNRR